MKHHVNQTLKILDDLREAHAEIERLRYDNESLRRAHDRLRAALADIQFLDCCYDTRVLADDALGVDQ